MQLIDHKERSVRAKNALEVWSCTANLGFPEIELNFTFFDTSALPGNKSQQTVQIQYPQFHPLTKTRNTHQSRKKLITQTKTPTSSSALLSVEFTRFATQPFISFPISGRPPFAFNCLRKRAPRQ